MRNESNFGIIPIVFLLRGYIGGYPMYRLCGERWMGSLDMKVIICDDSVRDLRIMEELLLQYQVLQTDRDFQVEKFSDPSELYREITEGRLADLYILDMLMPKRTGIDLGNQIRRCGGESIIIYVTSSDDYALDAYGVHAVRYLLKPIDREKLFEALDHGISLVEKNAEAESVYLVKTKDGLVRVPYSKIEYIENANRKLEVHLLGGEYLKSIFIRKSFEDEIQDVAENGNFLQVHKSFVVNLDHVKQLGSGVMIMESGRQIPVSKAKAANVKREYLLFVSGKYK